MVEQIPIKRFILTAIICLALGMGCTKQIVQEVISDPTAHHMKIIPSYPTSQDEIKLVIYDDCNYNTLTGITRTGQNIYIVKQFNSMMMRPCIMVNDTIKIGKLSQGSYILNYKLLDNARTPPKITLNLNFNLIVSQ